MKNVNEHFQLTSRNGYSIYTSLEIYSRHDEFVRIYEDFKLPELCEDIAKPGRKPVQGTTPVPKHARTNHLQASQIPFLIKCQPQWIRLSPSNHLQLAIKLLSQIPPTDNPVCYQTLSSNRHSNQTPIRRRSQNNHNPLKSIRIVSTMNPLTTHLLQIP